jgi:hypothetical protein
MKMESNINMMPTKGEERKGIKKIVEYLHERGGSAMEAEIYKAMKIMPRATVQYRINKLEAYKVVKRDQKLNSHALNQNMVYLLEDIEVCKKYLILKE